MKAFLILLFLCLLTPPALAEDNSFVILYQQEEVLRQRVPEATSFANYIEEVENLATPLLQSGVAENFSIVVMVKPSPNGGSPESKIWFVSDKTSNPKNEELKERLKALTPPSIQLGPIVFGLSILLNGAEIPNNSNFRPPIPTEWEKFIPKGSSVSIIPDNILESLWEAEKN